MENPKMVRNLYKHINISKKYDFVAGDASKITDRSCTSDDRYNENGKTIDILIDCNCTGMTRGTGGHSIQQSTDCLNVMKERIGNIFKE